MIHERPISQEVKLLFVCARTKPDLAEIRSIVEAGVDWPSFLAQAETHGLRPLVFRHFENACSELIPLNVLESLRKHSLQNTQRNLLLTGELIRIVGHLVTGGLPALAFKGPVLAWWLYEHPGLREFQDLDLLVEERDLGRAQQLLGELGYRAHGGRNGEAKIIRSAGQMSLSRSSPEVLVDLHWELAPRSMGLSLNAQSVLPRSTTRQIAGRRVLTFGTEDQFLLCALHGGKHGWTNLIWLADLAALIETRPPDWARLMAEARRMRLSRALFAGLRLAHDLLRAPLPAEVWNAMREDTAAAAIARDARSHLRYGQTRRQLFPRELAYELQLTEGWARQARFLWRKITEPGVADWEARSNSASRLAGNPLTRPLRLLQKYFHRLMNRFRRTNI